MACAMLFFVDVCFIVSESKTSCYVVCYCIGGLGPAQEHRRVVRDEDLEEGGCGAEEAGRAHENRAESAGER